MPLWRQAYGRWKLSQKNFTSYLRCHNSRRRGERRVTRFTQGPRAGAKRSEVSRRSLSLAGQISLGGTGRRNRYRGLPRPPFDLSVND
jgi:hypothetical protein